MKKSEKIYNIILEKIGYDVISNAFKRYLLVYACYMVASVLSTSFFNIFLLKAIGSADALVWYNLLLACVQPIVMVFAIPVLRKLSVNACQQIGLGLHAAAYAWLAITYNVSPISIYIISCVFSAGNAFYFISYTPQILAFSDDETRDAAYGAMGLLNTVGNLLLPIGTGFFITTFGTVIGYRAVFSFSAIVLALGILFSFRLNKVNVEKNIPFKQTWYVFCRMIKNKDMLKMLIITMLTAAEVAGKAYYGSVLLKELLKEESVIGTVITVGGLVGLFANLIYGKYIKTENRGKYMLIGAIVTLLATIFLNIFKTSYGYIIYSVLYAFAAFFIATPVVTEYMGVLQKDEMLNEYGAEVHACREFFYASGRAIGLVPAFFIPATVTSSSLLLIFIVILQIISGLMIVRIKK